MIVRNPGELDISGLFRSQEEHVGKTISKTTGIGLAVETEVIDSSNLQTSRASH